LIFRTDYFRREGNDNTAAMRANQRKETKTDIRKDQEERSATTTLCQRANSLQNEKPEREDE
jgi:hypothetical protein